MKNYVKILSLILASIMIFALASCAAMAPNEAGDADGMMGILNNGPNYSFSDDKATAGSVNKGDISGVVTGAPTEEATEACPEQDEMEEPAEDVGQENDYPSFVENPFINSAENNISTFSADVDTASYAYFRKLVNMGYGIDELIYSGSTFRTEEFINYFKYNVDQPTDEELFGVTSEIVPCPWNSSSLILRMTLQAEKARETAGNNLVFLIDVSGSMMSSDKLPLLKKAFGYLVDNLGENDRVSIVTYSGKETVVLEGCAGNKKTTIINAINSLNASGSTNGEAGLIMAYRIAEANMIEGGNNRIIMASDGDLNVGISSAEELKSFVEQKRDQGVYLSVLGFGTGNYRDANMEALADNGNGVYYYIDGESEAEKVFATDLLGTLYTVAEDVKLQIEFNPEAVESYRLIGYENRMLNKEDFENDAKDAGEVGASHQVTVCYEIKLAPMVEDSATLNSFATLRVRYKNPGQPISLLNEYQITESDMHADADDDMRFISCVVKTCMILHRSEHLNGITLESVLEELDSLNLSSYPEREEFRTLVRTLAERQK